MQAIGFLVVDGPPEMPAALRAWPWLRAVPRPWRRRLVRLAGPKPVLVAESTDGGIQAYGLLLAEGSSTLRLTETLRRMEEKLTFRAFGWRAAGLAPLPGRSWRSGTLFGLLTAIAPFAGRNLPFGPPEELTVLLQGEARAELGLAARFLAPRVAGLFLVCPQVYFRRQLAARILAEYGLAVRDGGKPPEKGWDVAVDLRFLPPLFRVGPRLFTLRPVFPQPLLHTTSWQRFLSIEHPVWAECHLSCLLPEKTSLPSTLTPASLAAAFSLLETAGVEFALT